MMRSSQDYGEHHLSTRHDEGEELDVLVAYPGSPTAADSFGGAGDDDDGSTSSSASTSSPVSRSTRHGPTRRYKRSDDDIQWWSPSRVAASYGKRVHRHTGLFRLTLLSSILLGAALATFVGYWLIRFFLLRYEAYGHSVFAEPMIPDPKDLEPLAQPFQLEQRQGTDATMLDDVRAELMRRYVDRGMQASTLECTWTSKHADKYSDLPKRGPYFFALNLFNSEEVLPALASTLLELVVFLGVDNAHISIFENGSWDRTRDGLANLAAALTALGVAHTITSDERETDWDKVDRIAQLAVYRNIALASVNSSIGIGPKARRPEEVVFVNDVFACPSDALELIYQRKHQNADASCALDWRATSHKFAWLGFNSVKFYDNWVTRSITGDMLRNRIDILGEYRDGINELFDQPGQEYSRERFRNGVPTPVYSCWNGMLALPAKPFQGSDERPATLFRSVFNVQGDCAASECKTLAKDFWAQGLSRWMIVPSVHVTYKQDIYHHPRLEGLASRHERSQVPEKIEWDSLAKPKSVVCYPWARGFHIDLPYRRTREPPRRRSRW